ncbi:primase-helicase family protein [Christiangramia portivictoriae]|uniref:primase-helicase family protein n=1 Tax=Christiangramia portivictoriae TaxID=326069 RepID=UPI00040E62F5|nr:primase-helicase family protein [Christiangramia portivictoriae]
MKYLRIGSEYYKSVLQPTLYNRKIKKLIKWKRQTIIDDHGKDELDNIPKYDGFTVIPSHENYEKEIGGFYNKYSELNHTKKERGYNITDITHTLGFLKHIFGEQFEIGLDYLSLLWHKPSQLLPILCLVSEERSTGKTTFLNWLKLIFQDNMTLNKNEDLRSRFNSDWTDKLVIGIDEVLLDRKEDTERLKNLSTAKDFKTEAKGKDKDEKSFFGKFILCSNNETNFILIDEKEIRFWVRKIKTLNNSDPNLPNKLEKEIPWFVKYLSNRNIKHKKQSRMWFTRSQIHTEALENLIKGTMYNNEKELVLILDELLEDFNVGELKFTLSDLQELFSDSKVRISRRELNRILEEKWKLEKYNSSYKKYYKTYLPGKKEWCVEHSENKGRYYTFRKDFIKSMLKS